MYDIVAIALSLSLFHLNKKISVVEEWIEIVFENIEWDSPRESEEYPKDTPRAKEINSTKTILTIQCLSQPKHPFKLFEYYDRLK